MEELNFLKIRKKNSLECILTGSRKISYPIGFQKSNIHLEPNISVLAREMFVISKERKKQRQIPLLTNISEGIFKEAMCWNPKDSTKVVSEDEGDMVSIEDIVYQGGSFSEGSSKKKHSYSISLNS